MFQDDKVDSSLEYMVHGIFNDPYLITDISNDLFHFTNISTLPKIIKKDCMFFRMTHGEDFKDKKEGKTIRGSYLKCCKKLYKDKKIDKALYKEIKLIMNRNFYVLLRSNKVSFGVYTPFILCFTNGIRSTGIENFMWKNYCKKYNGCKITIPSAYIHTSHMSIINYRKKEDMHFDFMLRKIIYGKKKQVEFLYNNIVPLLDIYKRHKNESPKEYDIFKSRIENLLSNSAFIFKRSRFRKENEARLIFFVVESDLKEFPNVISLENGRRFVTLKIDYGISYEDISICPYCCDKSQTDMYHSIVDAYLK